MSAQVSAYLRTVLPATDLSVTARHVADALGHYANRDGIAWCSVDALAARTGLHAGTIRRARAELVAAGIITVDLSTGGRGRTNTYRFPVAAFIHNPRTGARVTGAETRAQDAQTRAQDAQTRAQDAQTRVHHATKIHRRSMEVPAAASARWCPPDCATCDGTGFIEVRPHTSAPCPARVVA